MHPAFLHGSDSGLYHGDDINGAVVAADSAACALVHVDHSCVHSPVHAHDPLWTRAFTAAAANTLFLHDMSSFSLHSSNTPLRYLRCRFAKNLTKTQQVPILTEVGEIVKTFTNGGGCLHAAEKESGVRSAAVRIQKWTRCETVTPERTLKCEIKVGFYRCLI